MTDAELLDYVYGDGYCEDDERWFTFEVSDRDGHILSVTIEDRFEPVETRRWKLVPVDD